MNIQRTSPLTHKKHTRNIDVVPEKYEHWISMPSKKRPLLKKYFPELSEEDREFLLTGITPEEWAEFDKENNALAEERERIFDKDGNRHA